MAAMSWGARLRHYLVVTSNGFVMGLFGTLIAGVILAQIGKSFHLDWLAQIGQIAQYAMGPGIGFGVAWSLSAVPLVTAAAVASGTIGAGTVVLGAPPTVKIGEPVGAYLAAIAAVEVGRRLAGRTPVDIVLTPSLALLAGGAVGVTVAPIVARFITSIGNAINHATTLQPLLMGIVISVTMGLVLVSPTSSAALSIAMGLEGLAAGASLAGGTAQMVGFGFGTFLVNGTDGLFAQAIGTAKLQLPNIIAKPAILLPTTLVSVIAGPLSTEVFGIQTTSVGAGMGSAGFVGQIATLSVMGSAAWPGILVVQFALPALLTPLLFAAMLRRGTIQPADVRLPEGHGPRRPAAAQS
jgi:hypothetical protein